MPAFPNAHALVVGIAAYQNINPLPHVSDAPHVAELLRDPNHCGYLQENVRTLSDAEATLPALRSELAALAARCDKDSAAFIYFSGHGGRIDSGPHAGEYLLPVETKYPSDADLAQTALPGKEFTAALNQIKARQLLVVLDCCHAAGVGQPKDLVAVPLRPGLSEGYYEQLKAGRGRVILASCRADELSYVHPQAEYGVFTEHFLAGLRGGVASDDGWVRIFDLFEYLQPRVTAAEKRQHPIFKAELEENFPVAQYKGGVKGVVPQVEPGYRYDAYVSYVDKEPDKSYVWKTLVPKMEAAGLRVAVSNDSEEPGVARVVGVSRAIRESKRTVVVLSEAYLEDHMASFLHVVAATIGWEEGTYRLLPVKIAPVPAERMPDHLGILTMLDLTEPERVERRLGQLVKSLQGPLPKM